MSNGNDRNLEVLGTDFTAQGIDFVDGTDVLGDGGGNVIIDAVGNHEIVDCSFRNGASSDGGNLAVRKADNFFLAKSSFINGATFGLGGAWTLMFLEASRWKDVRLKTIELIQEEDST
jgi:hypothetical protein